MNREDRLHLKNIKDILKEARDTAEKDSKLGIANAYYNGLAEGYAHAFELIRRIKWVIIYAEPVGESLIVAMVIHVVVSMKK